MCLLAAMVLSSPLAGTSFYPYALGVLTFGVGYGYAWVDNRRTENAREQAIWRAWERDDLELVCGTALTSRKPVAVTLDSGKVYVGMVADTFMPSSSDKSYLSILPIYSGYRSNDDHSFNLIHRYQTLIDGLLSEPPEISTRATDYMIVIPRDRIVTAHIFNEDLYREVSGRDTNDVAPPTANASS